MAMRTYRESGYDEITGLKNPDLNSKRAQKKRLPTRISERKRGRKSGGRRQQQDAAVKDYNNINVTSSQINVLDGNNLRRLRVATVICSPLF